VDGHSASSPKSAFIYFLTATFISGLCMALFMVFLSRHGISLLSGSIFLGRSDENPREPARTKPVPLLVLLKKLRYLCFGVWFTFCTTMAFPVFTQSIISVHTENPTSRLFQPEVFIPVAFLIWNTGDLLGRISCGWEMFTVKSPHMLAIMSLARIVFIPLYFMCNISGKGADVESDLFYMLVQLGFGFTNGWIGSNCMMLAPAYVDEDEKEACGGFMGLCLVFGLAVGSFLSFLINM
jgi:equilibrative nucleoside transporter 1/2/3